VYVKIASRIVSVCIVTLNRITDHEVVKAVLNNITLTRRLYNVVTPKKTSEIPKETLPGWVAVFGWVYHSVCNQPTRSTQPCIPPESLNRVPASAGVRAGMSPLPGGR